MGFGHSGCEKPVPPGDHAVKMVKIQTKFIIYKSNHEERNSWLQHRFFAVADYGLRHFQN